MLKILSAAALLLAVPVDAAVTSYQNQAAFTAATGATLAEDFESVAPALRDQGLPVLVRASFTFAPVTNDVVVASPGYDNFGNGASPTSSVVLTANGEEHFMGTLHFATPQSALGMTVLLNDLGPATLDFYAGATLLYRASFPADAANIGFAGISGDQAITHFVFNSVGGNRVNTGIDNIYAAPLQVTGGVPEPASWALLLIGFGAIGSAARRRSANHGSVAA